MVHTRINKHYKLFLFSKTRAQQRYFIPYNNNIMMSRLCDVVFTKIKSSEVQSCVFSIIFGYLIKSLWQYYNEDNINRLSKLLSVKTQDCLSGVA